jgi:2-C-methyl-D-erythritol 4-phosphate cytidylyltransferase/2-C-methyl-D-erythritol 2,4-cyclodiphosphate synthase
MAASHPKQFLKLSGIPVIVHTIASFLKVKEILWLAIPVANSHKQLVQSLFTTHFTPEERNRIIITSGGASRQLSVRAGLLAMPEEVEIVLVHDGARPLVSQDIIKRCIHETSRYGAVIAALEVHDTLKIAADKFITTTVKRTGMFRAQTPQAGRRHLIEDAFNKAEHDDFIGTDEASLFEHAGIAVFIVTGEEQNLKITRQGDLELAAHILASRAEHCKGKNKKETQERKTMRIGHGFDAHRLVKGRRLILGGEKIEFHLGLAGHSDADVLIHALMDAILGAIGEGDIGRHFPDSDEQYRGADSLTLLAGVVALAEKKHFSLNNADLTIICQQPKLAPYLEKITSNLTEVCKTSYSQINIKATTTEQMGYTGRGEGISCHAVVLMEQITWCGQEL